MFDLMLQIADSTVRVSVPLVLASMAGLFSERSGIVNIALEGTMLAAAFTAAAISSLTGDAVYGLLCAVFVAVFISLIHGVVTIVYQGNHIISGLAINMFVSGITVTVGTALFNMGGITPMLIGDSRFTSKTLPFVESFGNIPVFGDIYVQVISGHLSLVYVAFFSIFATWWIVFRTRFGLRLRATGENAHAVDTAGISVYKIRFMAMACCGVLLGIAGTYISTGQNAGFIREMTAGQGYMALAALIFGKWRPVPVLFGCLLFSVLDAISIRLQGVDIIGVSIPIPLIQALPYILTIILLAGFIGKAIPPKDIGKPYVKEH